MNNVKFICVLVEFQVYCTLGGQRGGGAGSCFLRMNKTEVWLCFKRTEEAGEVVIQLGQGSRRRGVIAVFGDGLVNVIQAPPNYCWIIS